MENLIIEFRMQLLFVLICALCILIFVAMDLWAGVRKSKRPTFSYGFQKTLQKLGRYYNYFFAFVIIDVIQISLLYSLNMSNGYRFWVVPIGTAIISLFIGITEIKSIFEKESKKERKRIEETADIMIQMAELMTNTEIREKIKEISDKINEEKNKINESDNEANN